MESTAPTSQYKETKLHYTRLILVNLDAADPATCFNSQLEKKQCTGRCLLYIQSDLGTRRVSP